MAYSPITTKQELQNQLTDLKAEILELTRTLSERAGDAAQRAQPAIDEAADTAQEQGFAVIEAVRDNPKTAAPVDGDVISIRHRASSKNIRCLTSDA